jgi:hypothetical protein
MRYWRAHSPRCELVAVEAVVMEIGHVVTLATHGSVTATLMLTHSTGELL